MGGKARSDLAATPGPSGEWGPWSPCSVPCGGGYRNRTRGGGPNGRVDFSACGLQPCAGEGRAHLPHCSRPSIILPPNPGSYQPLPVTPETPLPELLWVPATLPRPPRPHLEPMPLLGGEPELTVPGLGCQFLCPQGPCLVCVPGASGGWTAPRALPPVRRSAPLKGQTRPAFPAVTAHLGLSCL